MIDLICHIVVVDGRVVDSHGADDATLSVLPAVMGNFGEFFYGGCYAVAAD